MRVGFTLSAEREHMLLEVIFLMASSHSTFIVRFSLAVKSRPSISTMRAFLALKPTEARYQLPSSLLERARLPHFITLLNNGWRSRRHWRWYCHRLIILGDNNVRIRGYLSSTNF